MFSHSNTNGHEPKQNGNGGGRNLAELGPSRSTGAATSARDLLRVFFRHRRVVVTTFAVIMSVTALYALFAPRQYRSEAKLFVRLGRENLGLDATTTLGQAPPTTSVPVSREEEINTVVAILESRGLLEKVVDTIGAQAVLDPIGHPLSETTAPVAKAEKTEDRVAAEPGSKSGVVSIALEHLGLKNPLSLRDKAIAELRKHVGIEATKKSNVIVVSHEGPSPKVSQQIVSKLIDVYLDEHMRMNRTPRAHQFLKEQASALKAQLVGQEDHLRKLKDSTGLASPAEQRQNLVVRMGHLEDELKTTDATAAAAEAEIKALGERLSKMSPTQVLGAAAGYPNLAADGMRQQLYTLQLKEKDLASRVTDQHVELKFVREQIASAKKVLDGVDPSRTQTTVGPNKNYEELRLAELRQQANLASLRAKATTLRSQLAETRQEMQTLNDSEMRIAQVQRDLQILDASYRKYADSLEQARIDESLERERISNINIAEAPTLNPEAVRPRALLTLVLGLVGGLFGGLCLALGIEYFDHSMKSSDEVERLLNVPVLASIPQVSGRQFVAPTRM